MKKSELRVWAIRTHLPDEWWVEINGEVSESVLNLDEAFRRGENESEAFIIHGSHAEEAEEPHWIRMGIEEQEDDPFGLPAWVCTKCKHPFKSPVRRGISKAEVLGYLLIIPGIWMTARRLRSRRARCPNCKSLRIVEGSSKSAKAFLQN